MKGVLIDVQGTLIDDRERRPIPGTVEAVNRLYEAGVPFVLVTNNTKFESDVFRGMLREVGFCFDDGQYLDPLMVLDGVLPPCRVAAYGSKPFLETLQRRGYRLDFDRCDAVVVAIRPDFTNDDYAQMIERVMEGARLVGMHETSIYAKNGRRYPGVGAILRMVSFATGVRYDVVGKPSDAFYAEALRRLRLQAPQLRMEEIAMVSDDLVGDLMGARRLGMRTVLVFSGKIASEAEVADILREGADETAETAAVWLQRQTWKGAA